MKVPRGVRYFSFLCQKSERNYQSDQLKQYVCNLFRGTVISPEPLVDRTDESVCEKVQRVFLVGRIGGTVFFDGFFRCFCDGFGHFSGKIGISIRREQEQTELSMALVIFHIFCQLFPELCELSLR